MDRRFTTASESLQSGGSLWGDDWRHDAAPPPPPAPPPPTPRRAPADPLHRNVRPASPAKERQRAADIVTTAKAAVVDAFRAIREGKGFDPVHLAPVVEAVAASIARDPTALPGVTRLKERHEYTYVHSVSVCGLMIGLAAELGLDRALYPEIGLAGLLHDVGKARIPTLLLDKPGALTHEEFAVIRTHPERGHELLLRAGVLSPIVLDVCLHHHERFAGGGYPSGASGNELSIYARMSAVCDVFDAVTSARAYKNSWTPGQALEWMTEATGHFDRAVLAAFTRLIGPLSIGTLVRLTSDRLGLVVGAGNDTGRPVVAAFHCALTNRALPATLAGGNDAVLSVERAARWHFDDWGAARDAVLREFGAIA